MASAQFETDFENIVFSFTVTNCNLNQEFHWGDEWAMLPFHHDLFKVNIKVVDTETTWFYHGSFYVSAPDWVSRKEQREYVYQVIMSEVKFCNHINSESHDDVGFKQMKKSVHGITKKIGDYMVDWYKQNHKSEFK